MEILELTGYTDEDKLNIAQRYLVPKQTQGARAVARDVRRGPTTALLQIIQHYTREAGVRNLEREIGTVCRKIATRVAEDEEVAPRRRARGDPRVPRAAALLLRGAGGAHGAAGVSIGVGVTGVGGDIMFIEATRMPGKGSLTVTGQLGDVMQESAQAAMSFVRSRARRSRHRSRTSSRTSDLHIHVPAGAIPKDGPSAGVAMTTALVSLLTGVPVRDDVAMTGEITLRGQVLPVGGIKEKALAARRAGVTTFVLPRRNEVDLDDLPKELREEMTFVLADARRRAGGRDAGGVPRAPAAVHDRGSGSTADVFGAGGGGVVGDVDTAMDTNAGARRSARRASRRLRRENVDLGARPAASRGGGFDERARMARGVRGGAGTSFRDATGRRGRRSASRSSTASIRPSSDRPATTSVGRNVLHAPDGGRS